MSEEAVQDYQEAFARIEAEVDRGNTDLAGLGFWRLVGQVKLERRLAEHWAGVVGRIDRKAFETRTRIRIPVWLGSLLLLLGSVVMVALLPITVNLAKNTDGDELWGLVAVLVAGGLSGSLHDLAHWVVGRLAGMRFHAYFLKMPFLVPGLKIDYASYLRTSPGARAWMHASGAIVSKIAPFAVFAAVYLPHRASGYDLFPSWSLWAILAIGVIQIVTDILFSTRRSDWKRVRRELRVGRSMESIPRR